MDAAHKSPTRIRVQATPTDFDTLKAQLEGAEPGSIVCVQFGNKTTLEIEAGGKGAEVTVNSGLSAYPSGMLGKN